MIRLGKIPTPFSDSDCVGLFNLLNTIEDNTFSLEEYAKYLDDGGYRDGIFAVWVNDQVKGILHAIKPCILDKTKGYILFGASSNDISKKENIRLLWLVEAWLKEHGADHWVMQTKRNAKAWKKKYNLKIMNEEATLGKDIK